MTFNLSIIIEKILLKVLDRSIKLNSDIIIYIEFLITPLVSQNIFLTKFL